MPTTGPNFGEFSTTALSPNPDIILALSGSPPLTLFIGFGQSLSAIIAAGGSAPIMGQIGNGSFPAGFTPTVDLTGTGNVVPLPAALPLFATGIGGLGLLGWRRKRKAQPVISKLHKPVLRLNVTIKSLIEYCASR